MSQFKKLLEPTNIGSIKLKHRMVQGPMWSRLTTADGEVTDQMLDYYAARARGGAALVVIESTSADSRYGWDMATLRLDDPKMVPGYARLVETIHLFGIPAIAQLINVGPSSSNPISPSGVPSVMHGMVGTIESRPMTIEDIEEQRDKFIRTAALAKEAGCEGTLVHGATSYLIHQFLSAYTNKRTDQYGGSMENRMRFPLEIIRGIRKKCGPDFVIGFVLVADELIGPAGLTLEETVKMAKVFEDEGVDYLDSMIGMYETFATSERSPGHSKYTRFGPWEITREYKNAVKIPVIARVQGDYIPDSWEKHLQAGDADIVQLAKSTLIDAEIYNKIVEGRPEEIRECTCCCDCLDYQILVHYQVTCALNPEVAKEGRYAIKKVDKPEKVLVIGAGPGGLVAAKVAALRGHEVTVLEKEDEPGGKLKYANLCEDNETYGKFRDFEVREAKRAGVKFEFGKTASAESILAQKPDAVIVATGAPDRVVPEIQGIDKPNVVVPEDVLTGKAKVGDKVVILGGNRVGCDMSYTLMKRGLAKEVTIVEPQMVHSVGYDMETLNMVMLTVVMFPKLGVQAMTGTKIAEITDKGVNVVDQEGKKVTIPADTVINSMGYEAPKSTLYEELEGKVKKLYKVGDCIAPRRTRNAVHEAAFVAREI